MIKSILNQSNHLLFTRSSLQPGLFSSSLKSVLHSTLTSRHSSTSTSESTSVDTNVSTVPPSTLKQDHGLSAYFESDTGTWYWQTLRALGRAWKPDELRGKSFEELHGLWWTCLKEKNKLLSQKEEARRFRLVFPHHERLKLVALSMRGIKQTLWERRTSYLQAQYLFRREKFRESLISEGNLSEQEIAEKVSNQFPVPLHEVGESKRKVLSMRNRLAQLERMSQLKKDTRWTVV